MGGNATGSGMQFQAKLGALALATMLPAGFTLKSFQLADVQERAAEVAMETENEIDDLRIRTAERTIFVQAKTTLSVSGKPNSEFRKVIDQFLRQDAHSKSGDHFVLIVSSDSGSRVKVELKTVLDTMRLNRWSDFDTWTKPQRDVARTLRETIEESYRVQFKSSLSEGELHQLIAKMWVFEQSRTADQQRYLIDALHCAIPTTEGVWGRLYAVAEDLIRKRRAITREGLKQFFLELNWNEEPKDLNLRQSLPTIIPSGCEFLLADRGGNFSLLALPRFDNEGNKIVSVTDQRLLFKNEEICTVLARGSSMKSLTIAIEAIQPSTWPQNNGKLIVHDYRKGNDDLTIAAKAHSASLRSILETRPNFSLCLICGHAPKANGSVVAEVDEGAHTVGLVHRACLDGSVRVHGYWKDDRFPIDTVVDLELLNHFEQLCNGGAAVHGYQRRYPQTGLVVAEWAPENLGRRRGPYVLQLVTEGDDVGYYCDYTQKTVGTTEEDAEELAAFYRTLLGDESANYFALGDSDTYGFIKDLEAAGSHKREKVTDIVVRKEPYVTRQWESQMRFWTPLLYLLSDGQPVRNQGRTVLFSDPEKVDPFVQENDINLPTLSLIETDAMFDIVFSNELFEGGELVIDPELRDDGSWDGHIVKLVDF